MPHKIYRHQFAFPQYRIMDAIECTLPQSGMGAAKSINRLDIQVVFSTGAESFFADAGGSGIVVRFTCMYANKQKQVMSFLVHKMPGHILKILRLIDGRVRAIQDVLINAWVNGDYIRINHELMYL